MPSKERPPNTDLQRAPLLEAQVEIEIAAGDLDRARSAADELERVADRFESKALVAGAALARGRVQLADGDAAGAEQSLLRGGAALERGRRARTRRRSRALCLADAHRASGSEHRAVLEREAARTILDGIEAAPPRSHRSSRGAPSAADPPPTAANTSSVARATTGRWRSRGTPSRVRDLKGMRYLARLLADPGREFHVLDLVAAETGDGAARHGPSPMPRRGRRSAMPARCSTRGPRTPTADASPRSTRTSRRRAAIGDAERAAQADAERDFLVRELARAVGLAGRDRRAASASERARAGVTRAVRQAMARIGNHHALLGEHLDRSVRTGTYCGYFPDPRAQAAWTT